jgi:3-hydroxyisobutyrate dehydrogenase-like beta-hydroxyacid dehydrogenase
VGIRCSGDAARAAALVTNREIEDVTAQKRFPTIGFIGLGQMGLPIAKHILASGRQVIAWSPNPDERASFARAGGGIVDSLDQVAGSPLVLSMVYDDTAVRSIALAEEGLINLLQPGATHITMETISPTLSREVSDAYAARGLSHLAAPVFGTPGDAAAAALKINCSGPEAIYQSVAPVLATFGTPYWFGPDPQTALMVKIMGNNMIFTIVELLHEAFTFLERGGVDRQTTKEMVIDRLFESPLITDYAKMFVDHPGVMPGFSLSPIPRKDNDLCLDMAEQLGVELALVRLVREKMRPAG